jgi:hypothetical protein
LKITIASDALRSTVRRFNLTTEFQRLITAGERVVTKTFPFQASEPKVCATARNHYEQQQFRKKDALAFNTQARAGNRRRNL